MWYRAIASAAEAGTYTFEPSTELADVTGMDAGELGPGEVTAQRMVAEAMGEAIGPLPDVDQPPPQGEGSSPAPEVSPTAEEMPAVEEASPAPEGSPAA